MLKDYNIKPSAIFITFSGNCKMALTFYQACFGGILQFETFDKKLEDYNEELIINGSLICDSIIIHGSDLVHDEGRQLGNYMSIFLQCKDIHDRKTLVRKLSHNKKGLSINNSDDQRLIEIIDAFDVRWILGVLS